MHDLSTPIHTHTIVGDCHQLFIVRTISIVDRGVASIEDISTNFVNGIFFLNQQQRECHYRIVRLRQEMHFPLHCTYYYLHTIKYHLNAEEQIIFFWSSFTCFFLKRAFGKWMARSKWPLSRLFHTFMWHKLPFSFAAPCGSMFHHPARADINRHV